MRNRAAVAPVPAQIRRLRQDVSERLRVAEAAGEQYSAVSSWSSATGTLRLPELCRDVLSARRAHEAAMLAANAAVDALELTLTTPQSVLMRDVIERTADVWNSCWEMHVAELLRHAPAIAPALRALFDDHIIPQKLSLVGRCCAPIAYLTDGDA